ncbi:MAG TPA: PASTA domain-containing protein [Gaiellaceae bacterium]
MSLGSRFRRDPATDATLVQEGAPGPPVVEEEIAGPPPPPPRGRPPTIWPWLLLLLLLVAGGLIALWLFTRDNGHKHARSVNVPNVIGQKQGPAVQRLDSVGLTSRVVAKPSSRPEGTVFAQQPGPGTHVTKGSVVTLSTSSTAEVTVPKVVGEKVAAAASALRAQGLSVQTANVTSTKTPGLVLSQSPAARSSVAKASTVTIRVSSGPTRVPNVVGQQRAAAVSVLKAAGLSPKVFVVPAIQPKNVVVAQRPHAGASVARGTNVRLNVSSGQAPAGGAPPPPPPPQPPPPPASKSVPDVTGNAQQGAQRQLNTLGFKSLVRYVPSSQPQGSIVSQSPDGGSSAKVGTRVTLNASLGPNPGAGQAVPKVIGLAPATARSRLENDGFSVQQLTQKTSTRSLSGKIVDVQPGRGVHAPAGSVVTIYVGRFS